MSSSVAAICASGSAAARRAARTGLRAKTDVMASAIRPPSSESRNRAPDSPLLGGWIVTTSNADTAASDTSTTLPPSATAATIAPAADQHEQRIGPPGIAGGGSSWSVVTGSAPRWQR